MRELEPKEDRTVSSWCRLGKLTAMLLALLPLAACGGDHEYQPPDREQRVAEAAGEFDPDVYDTLSWSSDSARAVTGNSLYAAECRQCHGYLGRGDTDYARERGLEVPSLVAPGWALADSLSAVRRSIYAGHTTGMPSWGVGRFTPRQIDAVAFYVLEQLRPEVIRSKERDDEEE